MENMIIFVIIAIAAMMFLGGNKKRTNEKKEAAKETEKPKAKYMDKFQLLNKTEQELMRRLHEVAETENLYVLSQVSMSQLFFINSNRPGAFQQLGEIGRKSIDFLLVRKQDTGIIAAIELNGPTHDSDKQKASDEKKKEALKQAGIPLITYFPQSLPENFKIKEAIKEATALREQYEKERNSRFRKS